MSFNYIIMTDNNDINQLKKQLMKELKPILLKIKNREYNRNYRNRNRQAYNEQKKIYLRKYYENEEKRVKRSNANKTRYNEYFFPICV